MVMMGVVLIDSLRVGTGPWSSMIWMLAHLHDRGLDFHSLSPIQVGDGFATSF